MNQNMFYVNAHTSVKVWPNSARINVLDDEDFDSEPHFSRGQIAKPAVLVLWSRYVRDATGGAG